MNDIAALLRFDSLSEAEKLTGSDYKTDENTVRLGLGLAMLNNEAKDRALAETDDTRWSLDFAGTVALWERIGFETVHTRNFVARDSVETYLVLWHPDGILGTVESYGSTRVNTQKVYYNVRPTSGHLPWDAISSGRYVDAVWVGDHDAREGLRFNLGRLREHGEFLPIWVERPWLSLLTYQEAREDGYDRKAITESVIGELPEHVRTAITPEVIR